MRDNDMRDWCRNSGQTSKTLHNEEGKGRFSFVIKKWFEQTYVKSNLSYYSTLEDFAQISRTIMKLLLPNWISNSTIQGGCLSSGITTINKENNE